MTILGIDPSLYGSGWALVECAAGGCYVLDSGTIRVKRIPTPKGRSKRQNLLELGQLHSEFDLVLRNYKFTLDAFAIEVPISLPGQQTAVLWQVQGLFRGFLGNTGLPGGCYDPGEVKAAVTGSRKAEKDVVMRFVLAQLTQHYQFGSKDESDAAAVALTHWHRQKQMQLSLPEVQNKRRKASKEKPSRKQNRKQKMKMGGEKK